MATLSDITTGVQTVTATGAVTPTTGLDISGVSGDATICLEITGMTAAKTARIQLEDSVNGFTAVLPVCMWDITGQVVDGGKSIKKSWRKYELNNVRFGTTNAVLRVNVMALDASSTLSLHAWLEQ